MHRDIDSSNFLSRDIIPFVISPVTRDYVPVVCTSSLFYLTYSQHGERSGEFEDLSRIFTLFDFN